MFKLDHDHGADSEADFRLDRYKKDGLFDCGQRNRDNWICSASDSSAFRTGGGFSSVWTGEAIIRIKPNQTTLLYKNMGSLLV
jgi:hypothetical protein